MDYQISTTREPGRNLAVSSFDATPDQIPERIGAAFGAVMASLQRRGLTASGPAVAFYEMSPDEPGVVSFRVSAGFFVPEPVAPDGDVRPLRLPEREMLTTVHVGAYTDLPAAYQALQKHAAEEGLTLAQDVMWEEYLTPPETPPDRHRTVVAWPLVEG